MVDAQRVGIATLVLVGSVAGFTASGVLNAFSDGYFLGRARKKGVTYKTCLLYTSPSPRDRQKSRMPSSA